MNPVSEVLKQNMNQPPLASSCSGLPQVQVIAAEEPLGVLVLAGQGGSLSGLGDLLVEQGFTVVRMTAGEAAELGPVDLAAWVEALAALLRALHQVSDWQSLPVGLLVSGLAAAAAFEVVAQMPEGVQALIVYQGELDGVGCLLPTLTIPTLLIVGEDQVPALRLHEAAFARLGSERKMLAVLPAGAEPAREAESEQMGALLIGDWVARAFG